MKILNQIRVQLIKEKSKKKSKIKKFLFLLT